ncbi:hypothetical protein SUDANB15_07065 [Streptomyces sp. enrichment culture]
MYASSGNHPETPVRVGGKSHDRDRLNLPPLWPLFGPGARGGEPLRSLPRTHRCPWRRSSCDRVARPGQGPVAVLRPPGRGPYRSGHRTGAASPTWPLRATGAACPPRERRAGAGGVSRRTPGSARGRRAPERWLRTPLEPVQRVERRRGRAAAAPSSPTRLLRAGGRGRRVCRRYAFQSSYRPGARATTSSIKGTTTADVTAVRPSRIVVSDGSAGPAPRQRGTAGLGRHVAAAGASSAPDRFRPCQASRWAGRGLRRPANRDHSLLPVPVGGGRSNRTGAPISTSSPPLSGRGVSGNELARRDPRAPKGVGG